MLGFSGIFGGILSSHILPDRKEMCIRDRYWEENKDALRERMGIESMDDLMDTLFLQMFFQNASSGSQGADGSGSEGGNR